MAEEQQINYMGQAFGEVNTKVKDLEEKQRILKDRLLLIGKNLIEIKEKNSIQSIRIKKDISQIKDDIERIKSFLEMISNEFSKFAKKEEVEILAKQAKMFQPLEFVTRAELKNIEI